MSIKERVRHINYQINYNKMSTFTMGAKTPYGRAQSLKSQIKKAEKTIVKGAIKYEKGKSKVDRKITKSLGFLEKGKFMKRDKSRKQIYNVGKSSRLNDRIGEPIFIRKREFVTNINGSTTFVNQSFPISMTNISLFPWVSSVAPSYEKYRVKKYEISFQINNIKLHQWWCPRGSHNGRCL